MYMKPYEIERLDDGHVRVAWLGELLERDPFSFCDEWFDDAKQSLEGDPLNLVELDVSQASDINSRGLAFLACAKQRCYENQVEWHLKDLSVKAERMIQFAGLESILESTSVGLVLRIEQAHDGILRRPALMSRSHA